MEKKVQEQVIPKNPIHRDRARNKNEFKRTMERLREQNKNMSLSDLSKKMGVSVANLSWIENGRSRITKEHLELIGSVFELSKEEHEDLINIYHQAFPGVKIRERKNDCYGETIEKRKRNYIKRLEELIERIKSFAYGEFDSKVAKQFHTRIRMRGKEEEV